MSGGNDVADWAFSSSLTNAIDDLAITLGQLRALADRSSPHLPGAALNAAYEVLRLAVVTTADEDEQMMRHEAVMDAVPVLSSVGLVHVQGLVEAALAHDVVAGRLVRGTATAQ